jgi:hypothetical protein
MNGWDLLTWVMAAILAGGSLLVFIFFLRDVRAIWHGPATEGRGEHPPEARNKP